MYTISYGKSSASMIFLKLLNCVVELAFFGLGFGFERVFGGTRAKTAQHTTADNNSHRSKCVAILASRLAKMESMNVIKMNLNDLVTLDVYLKF
ncbi:unnamed protein product [Ambrosiozyma monospora]|uniref:Unnamed protein product n=1 Tax=Ambrosiozyma monospora TaxID=43982 RepID=A0ACB5UC63_AMBMO|nr:unnamed protein product [Ambrosiozyma monospora]